jgi:hypothetical protein
MPNARTRAPQVMPPDFAALLQRMRTEHDPRLNPVLAAARRRGWHTETLARVLDSNVGATGKRIERAKGVAVSIADIVIPAPAWLQDGARVPTPIPPQTMMDGRRLPEEYIQRLREMQEQSSRVNGAMPVDHPDRETSEKFSAELHELIDNQRISSYYLAKVLGVSHRAIASRMERHGYRKPCPSTANTASARYRRRRIGDPTPADPTPEGLLDAAAGLFDPWRS